MTIHRGHLYYVEQRENTGETFLRRHKIGKAKNQSEIVYTSDIYAGTFLDIIGYGSNLYFKEYGNIDDTYVHRINRYDLLTGETSQILKEGTTSYYGMPLIINIFTMEKTCRLRKATVLRTPLLYAM